MTANDASFNDGTGIAAGAITPEKLVSGAGTSWAWQSWTPTLTNMAIGTGGSAELTGKYIQIGKTVFFRLKIVLGTSGQSVGSNAVFSLPVTANSGYLVGAPIGQNVAFDQPPGYYPGPVFIASTTTAQFIFLNSSINPAAASGTSSTIPFAWAAGDSLFVTGEYEAA